jgi:ribonuclease D
LPSKDETRTSFVRSAPELERVAEEARVKGTAGLDTEFMREKTYRARLCLVQISTRDGIYLIDPLDDLDLEPVAKLVADDSVQIVVHAGRQDFEIFFERFGVTPARIFDVQIAAGFAGLGASLPYGRLVKEVMGRDLEKAASYTDWCRRPLTDEQVQYAADDVRYLLAVADRLKDKLTKGRRIDWIEDEMAYLEDPSLYEYDPEEAWRRVSGRGGLSGRQQAILRELAAWRERTAARRDLPRGWVIKDQSLVEAARRAPSSVRALKDLRGFPAKEAERSGEELLEAIERGRKAPELRSPKRPSRSAQLRARTLSGLADAIVRSRCEHAGIATELVATRGELEDLLLAVFAGDLSPERHRTLRGWRKDLVGDAVVALAEGRIAVRSTPEPPYIEEVPLGTTEDT